LFVSSLILRCAALIAALWSLTLLAASWKAKIRQGNYINNAIDIEIWGKSAEVVVDRCKKGDCIMVSGNIKRQDWADKTTGDKRSKHVLSVSRFEFLPRTSGASDEVAF
jgi:single-stranded DNA-binding protein